MSAYLWDLRDFCEQMTAQVAHDVLRRMVASPPPAPEDVPITSSRAMRLAFTRAADKAHALNINVLGLSEEILPLDELLKVLSPDLMLVGMYADGMLEGLSGLDLNFRAALLEVQTVGEILPIAPEDRPATGTDASLSETLLTALLHHMSETTARTPLEGWGQGLRPDGKVATIRAAGLILPEREYRVIRLSLDLQVGERQGELVLALPILQTSPEPPPPETSADWGVQFQKSVNAAPARLVARLHRFSLPLFDVENLAVGQVLPLPGCTVSSVKLLAADGTRVATARLGQSGGMRAVRVEEAPRQPDMQDMEGLGAASGSGLTQMMSADGSVADDPMTLQMSGGEDDAQSAMMSPINAMDMESEPEMAMPMTDSVEDVAFDTDNGPSALSWDNEELDTSPENSEPPALDWSSEDL